MQVQKIKGQWKVTDEQTGRVYYMNRFGVVYYRAQDQLLPLDGFEGIEFANLDETMRVEAAVRADGYSTRWANGEIVWNQRKGA